MPTAWWESRAQYDSVCMMKDQIGEGVSFLSFVVCRGGDRKWGEEGKK